MNESLDGYRLEILKPFTATNWAHGSTRRENVAMWNMGVDEISTRAVVLNSTMPTTSI
jgi:hypothetical protein